MIASPRLNALGRKGGGDRSMTDQNGGAAAQNTQPRLSVLAQYVKDLSFENPDAPNSLRPREQAPRINIGINVAANQLSESDVEVVLKIEAKANENERPLFAIELAYAGVFRVLNLPADQVRAVVMIECPRLLFPFARQIIAEASRDGGFPPLMIDPVDFAALYRDRLSTQGVTTPQHPTPQ